jgi:PPK2 family polyphosphate:nucleotide phosphotransferase
MKMKEVTKKAESLARRYRVTNGKEFRLKDVDPGDTADLKSEDKPRAKEVLAVGIEALCKLQDMLYAQDRWAVLLIFQALDAAGKDSAIKHVMSGINPQGCQVVSFKAPSAEELDHDFLWRCAKQLPERGRIGIFNRSYYEETLVVRVHPGFLAAQKLPAQVVGKDIWEDRFRDIRDFERYLTNNGIAVCKFFLHVSKAEQKKRFLERIDDPAKNWKFSATDVKERGHWDEYMAAYEQTIRNSATSYAPWYAVPADHKWFTRLVVAAAVISTLASLDLSYPTLNADQVKDLEVARQALVGRQTKDEG